MSVEHTHAHTYNLIHSKQVSTKNSFHSEPSKFLETAMVFYVIFPDFSSLFKIPWLEDAF